MPTTDIIVRKRGTADYTAHLAESHGTWEAGRSEAEAIGKLVISAGAVLSIAVVREKPSNKR